MADYPSSYDVGATMADPGTEATIVVLVGNYDIGTTMTDPLTEASFRSPIGNNVQMQPTIGGGTEEGVDEFIMRAYDANLARYVFWVSSPLVDGTGAQYTGPGPLSDIVLIRKQ